MSNKGKLYLIPTPIAEGTEGFTLTTGLIERLRQLRHFVVENERTARRFLGSLHIFNSIEALAFTTLNKDTGDGELAEVLAPLVAGYDTGLLSDAGAPAVADPGAKAVAFAHAKGIQVVPLVGPSSFMMALMASGLEGQRFAFHGYLPVPEKEAAGAIRALEKESAAKHQTQILMETPHRNNAMLGRLQKYLRSTTRLSVAVDVTGRQEWIYTTTVEEWGHRKSELPKLPCVFLFQA